MKTLSSPSLLQYWLFIVFFCFTGFSARADDELQALQPTKEQHLAASVVAASAKTGTTAQANSRSMATSQAYQSTAWFQSIDLTLKRDLNGNGFYSQLYVRFDAHTDYASQPVYAIYSLIGSNGVSRRIHTSSIFTLYGQSSQDWFSVETNLVSLGRDYYKLKIQLVDAQSGYLLAEMSGYDNATLDRLALEDQHSDSYSQVIIHEESGGSFGIFALLGLSCVYLWRRKQHVVQNCDVTQCLAAGQSAAGNNGISAY
ncbi:choice-of-anchor H family protein [Rheinheimera sp.]|uniref:choice-of-anchor H family protein n=1 Tax=Rheinheimera sp. TaxID=1869214 RepID=UPI0027B9723A|nr:choice-of-anchor H family protein [Rheinheimera sp.]